MSTDDRARVFRKMVAALDAGERKLLAGWTGDPEALVQYALLESLSLAAEEGLERDRVIAQNLDVTWDDIALTVRTATFLATRDFLFVRDIARIAEKQLLGMKGCGRSTVIEIKNVLTSMGLRFGMDVEASRDPSAGGKPASWVRR